MVNRGDIAWFEPPELSRRPVLVLTRDPVIPYLNQLVAAPLTRTIRDIPTEVHLGEADGVPVECVVSLDNVFSVRPAFLTERITSLGPARMAEVCVALRRAVGC